MIFVCVGSREYQFDRLLKKIDELIENGDMTDRVYAQIGQSKYIPKHYEYKPFLSMEKFEKYQTNAELIISHGGTGALIGALKKEKKVIAVPRLVKYGEHIDDHQTQVAGVLEKEGYLKCVLDMNDLLDSIVELKKKRNVMKYQKKSRVINIINEFIESI